MRAEQPIHFGQELVFVTGQETAVDIRRSRLWDDIHLISRAEYCRIYRILQSCADNPRDRPYLGERLAEVVRDEVDLEGRAGGLQERAGRGDEPLRPLVAAQPGHGLGELGDRVVLVDHGTVPCRAARREPQPGHSLLRRLHQVEPLATERDAEAANLADRLGAALEEVRVVVHQPARAVPAARFLVREEREDHVARRPSPFAHPLPHDGEDHRVHVLHVHRAAAPDAAVVQVAGEGVASPVRRVGRHHVEVAVHEQRRPCRILARDPRHHAGAPGMRLEHRGLDARLGQQSRHVLGGRPLTRAGVVPRIRRVDADEVGAQPRHLVLGDREAGLLWVLGPVVAHPAIVARALAAQAGPDPDRPGGPPARAQAAARMPTCAQRLRLLS